MADVRDSVAPDADPDVLAYLRRAAAQTSVPGPFDVAAVLRGGRQRVARRRRGALAGVLAVAAVAAAIAVAPSLGQKSSAPVPGREKPRPSPTSTTGSQADLNSRLARLLGDPSVAAMGTQFAGPGQSSTAMNSCRYGGSCDGAILLTADGWSSNVVHLVPDTGWLWTRLLPDGSVAFVANKATKAGVLHPDGALTSLTVSREPGPAGAGSVLTNAPRIPRDGRYGDGLWVLDPSAATLRPLRTEPKGGRVAGVPTVADDGSVVVPMTDLAPPPTTVTIARSTDRGRTWSYSPVTAQSSGASLPGGLIVGPHGRMAVSFTSDGATVAPLIELWTSQDTGRTWTRLRFTHRPFATAGMAYAPDGTLLISEEGDGGMWRTTRDGADLERVPGLPRGGSLDSFGRVLTEQTGLRSFVVSQDGKHWTAITLPAALPRK